MTQTKQEPRLTSDYFERRVQETGRRWRDDTADWRDVAALILEWESAQPDSQIRTTKPPHSGSLKGEGEQPTIPAGMNKWLKVMASQLGFQVSNLWRYRKAVISAREIWKDSGHSVEVAFDIPEGVGPESIELAEKISRAAPSEIIKDVTERLYQNKITRSELRKIWQSIRHVVKDESQKIPLYFELPRIDEKRRGELFDEICFEALRKDLLENKAPILGKVGMCFRNHEINRAMVDIVAVTEDEQGCAIYHGVGTKASLRANRSLNTLEKMYSHFDYLWIAVPEDIDNFKLVPEIVGILQYIDGEFKVIRKPVRNPQPNLELVSRRIVPEFLKK